MPSTKQTFPISGMHCASCANIIKRRLKKTEGVLECEVSYANKQLIIDYDPKQTDPTHFNQVIMPLGYSIAGADIHDNDKVNELETLKHQVDLVLPVAILFFLLMIWEAGASTIKFVPNLAMPMPWYQFLGFLAASLILFGPGKQFLMGVIRFVRYRAANMDTLIGLGTLTAYLYSSAVLWVPGLISEYGLPTYTYFDVTIVVIGFVLLGKYLEERSKTKTSKALEKLMGLQVKTAILIKNGNETEVPIDEVGVGDVILVKPGGKIPVDGVVIEGMSAVNEAMISGEAIPVDKQPGDRVIGATINQQGALKIKAEKIGQDTLLAQIVSMVQAAQASKAPVEKLADRISAVFVPTVLIVAAGTALVWLILGEKAMALSAFVGILVIACPCALGLATPMAVITGVGKGAENGILIKNAESLQKLAKVDYMIMDKTGTLTQGTPAVSEVIPIGKVSKNEVMEILGGLESLSEHPLAQAVVAETKRRKLKIPRVTNFKAIEGKGLTGSIGKREYFAGNLRLATELKIYPNIKPFEKFTKEGMTPVLLMTKKECLGLVMIADIIKEDAKETVAKLHTLGIKVVMLTGDSQNTAQYFARIIGIDTVAAQVTPTEKAKYIEKLQAQGQRVAMVGDGINDAVALTTAEVGIAMGSGTDIAIEAAGLTLLSGKLTKLPQARKLAKATMRTIKQNLSWAFGYNLVGIPVAAGLLYPLWGITLNPAIAGTAMAFSSVSVVLNALRLQKLKLG